MISISATLLFFVNLSITDGLHNELQGSSGVPSLVTHFPSNKPSMINEETQHPSQTMLSETPSWAPSFYPIYSPSINPSVSSSLSPSSSPSLGPTNHPTTNSPSSVPSLTPSRTASSRPSKSPSLTPSLVPSRSKSFVPSRLPSSFPSVELSEKPSTFLSTMTTMSTNFVLNINAALNATEIQVFEDFLKNNIVELDDRIYIEDVTLIMQQLGSVGLRRLEIQTLSTDLDITGRLIQDHSDFQFEKRVKTILLDKDGYLQSRLYRLPMFQEKESNAPISDVEGAPKPQSTVRFLLQTFLGLSATVCIIVLIAIIVFLVTRSKRLHSNTMHGGQFNDPTQFPTIDDQEHDTMEEEDGDTSTISSTLILDDEALGDEGIYQMSTFSYSETSCDSGKDFMMSLTSSSIAVSETRRDSSAPKLHTIPLQENRHGSIEDEDMQDISIVETEINNADLNSKKKSSWTFTKLQSRVSFAQSDRTPKHSNLYESKELVQALSTVSSLSDKSSYTGGTSLHGTPYEVLVTGNKPLGLIIKSTITGPQILKVKSESPVHGIVEVGDYIISVDGKDTRSMSAKELSQWLHREVNQHEKEKTFILMSCSNMEENWLKMAKTV